MDQKPILVTGASGVPGRSGCKPITFKTFAEKAVPAWK